MTIEAINDQRRRWEAVATQTMNMLTLTEKETGLRPDEAACLIDEALAIIPVRDVVILRLLSRETWDSAYEALSHCESHGALTLAALCLWHMGRDAEALRLTGPIRGYGLADLVHAAVTHGLPRDSYRRTMLGLTEDECWRGVAN